MSLILQPTPDVRTDRVIVGTTVRKPPEVVQGYLTSLAAQRPVPGTTREYHFILDNALPTTAELIRAFVAEHGGVVEEAETVLVSDYNDEGTTHHWTADAMARVGRLKNRILDRARATKAEAVWFVDADLLLDPGTFRSLWYSEAPIACGVYWTKWHRAPHVVASPQVWLQHPYGLVGNGYPDEASFRAQLLTRQLTRVWGQGACTLLRRVVLDKGVDFSYVPGVSLEGMMAGEDRHFCLRADAAHLTMMADPWPHIVHIYHPDQRGDVNNWLAKLHNLQWGRPAWANLHLKLLEPLPVGPGQYTHAPPTVARIRLGCGQLLPDLERQVLEHLDGEPFVAEVLYPLHYAIPFLRGKKRLMEVTVVDWKVEAGVPVLEDDLLMGSVDPLAYTPDQQEVLRG